MSKTIKTILIIDDESFVRQSFADYFEDNLFRTLQAESCEEAMKLLDRESPDGVIVDIRLRGIDGDTFIRETYLKHPKIAFVISTGSPEYQIPPDLLELTCVSNHLFRKPVTNMNELNNEIHRIISKMNGNIE